MLDGLAILLRAATSTLRLRKPVAAEFTLLRAAPASAVVADHAMGSETQLRQPGYRRLPPIAMRKEPALVTTLVPPVTLTEQNGKQSKRSGLSKRTGQEGFKGNQSVLLTGEKKQMDLAAALAVAARREREDEENRRPLRLRHRHRRQLARHQRASAERGKAMPSPTHSPTSIEIVRYFEIQGRQDRR